MSEEFDFSELRNYLAGQIDLGEGELLLDEPWTLLRKPAAAVKPAPSIPVPPRPAAPAFAPSAPRAAAEPAEFQQSKPAAAFAASAPVPDTTGFQPSLFGGVPSAVPQNASSMPTPRTVKRTASAFESVESMDAFYESIKSEALYAKEPNLVRYAGPEKPKLLFLLPAVKPGETAENFLQTPVGEMLVRLFASLGYDASQIGVTYFFKSSDRVLSPLLETALRKMLAKELSFIAPELMVTFGQPLFYKVMGKGKNFDELAGTAMDFSGTKSVCLIDPYAMVNDKQMKWLTWKIHIPRSGLFTVKQ